MSAVPGVPDATPPPAVRVEAWADIAGLTHGFFGRHGGHSTGPFASLNVSAAVGDEPAAVDANWRRVARAAPGLRIVRMHQVHGARVVHVSAPDEPVGEADAMLAASHGVGLAVLTADCVPLLGVAPAHGAVLAVHAGWRGTLAGIAAAALTEARTALGIPLEAWQLALGPSIGGCCYEVEAEIGARLTDRWGALPDAWQPAGRLGQLDLRAANRAILVAAGARGEAIASVGPCTRCAAGAYFSHRASGGQAGRQVSLIGYRQPDGKF